MATLTLICAGMERGLPFQPDELVSSLVERAREQFPVPPVELALFTDTGVELDAERTAAEVGLESGQLVVLRPRIVRG